MIRAIDKTSTVKNQVSNRFELLAIPPQYSDIQESYLDTYQQEKVMIIREPIRNGTEIIGTLEIISEPTRVRTKLISLNYDHLLRCH